MELYAIPAFVALLLKLTVVFFARKANESSQLFLCMVMLFALHNVSELLVIMGLLNGQASEFLVRTYYAITFFALSHICVYTLNVSNSRVSKPVFITLMATAIIFTSFVFYTDLIVSGVKSIGYTVTAEQGSFYFAFQTYTLGVFVFTLATLTRGYLTATQKAHQAQCLYTIVAILPMILVGFTVMIAMQLGYRISAALVFPVASTIFLLFSLRSERMHGITDMGHFFTFSKERLTSNAVSELTNQSLTDRISLKQAKDAFEKRLLEHHLDRFDNNISKTAQALGMKRGTIYSIIKKYDISIQDRE